jgi:C1A family cysteine protease
MIFFREMAKWPKLTSILVSMCFFLALAAVVYADTVSDIAEQIELQDKEWVPAETSVTLRYSPEERMNLLGLIPEADVTKQVPNVGPFEAGVVTGYDWRDVGGANYVTPIKDQAYCGSCFAFACTAALESQVLIDYSLVVQGSSEPPSGFGWTPGTLDLSEQTIVSQCCRRCGDCGGGWTSRTSYFLRTTGIPTEECYPYIASNDACNACPEWPDPEIFQVTGYGSVSQTVDDLKAAVYTWGPLVVGMYVYEDFYYYSGGIYEHVSGSGQGWHAITLVGWDDAKNCFIVKNSWGTDWGEDGFFRIRYSEVSTRTNFGSQAIAYFGSVYPPPSGPTWSISGTITDDAGVDPLPDITVRLTENGINREATTDSDGDYQLVNVPDGSYTVTPEGPGYDFEPTQKNVFVDGADVSGVNFLGTAIPTYTVSGTITDATSGLGIQDVLVTLDGMTTTSNSGGDYAFKGVRDRIYTVVPEKQDYSFMPTQQDIDVNSANITGVDFTGAIDDPPTIRYMYPRYGSPGNVLNFRVSGSNFYEPVTVDLGQGIEVTEAHVLNDRYINGTMRIGCGVLAGYRVLTVSTPGGSDTLERAFMVKDSYPPRLYRVIPYSGERDQDLEVILYGSYFSECGLYVDFGQGITVTDLELIDSRRIRANIHIDQSAETGYCDVTVTTDAGYYTKRRAFIVR